MMKIKLVQTSSAAPEQYDAYDETGNQVGYLRLRHGWFRVDVPDCGGKTIYEAYPKGDACFEDEEREQFLYEAEQSIINDLKINAGLVKKKQQRP